MLMNTASTPVLIMDKNRGFRQWLMDEIYLGPESKGKYVPNLDDAVIDWERGLFRVTYVDPTTYVPTLQRMDPATYFGVHPEDALLGVDAGYVSEKYRLYVDNTVTPSTITVDSIVKLLGSDNVKCKIFHGSDISENGKVISARINQSGQVIDDALELELVETDPTHSTAIKVPRSGHTTFSLHDGELVTLVAYNSVNAPSHIVRLLVKNTRYVKRANAPVRHVTGVRIVSPHLSKTEQNTLLFPLNIPLSSMLMEGLVLYSDGTEKRMNIDGTNMVIHGLDEYVPSIVNQIVPLTVHYRLDDDETSFMNVSSNGTVYANYNAVTVDEDVMYNVKLFVAPQWVNDTVGYRLRFFLYNMDRDLSVEVTEHVDFDAVNYHPFQPGLYGVEQKLAAVVNLKDVDSKYMSYKHIQTFTLTLLGPAHALPSPWVIDYNSDGENLYGSDDIHANFERNLQGDYDVTVIGGHTELSDWLVDVYLKTDPLINRNYEGSPITPTHMRVKIDNTVFYRPVSQWRQVFTVDFVPNSSCTVDIFWVKETGTTNLELGQSTLNMYVV
jgi:hypothetical protein